MNMPFRRDRSFIPWNALLVVGMIAAILGTSRADAAVRQQLHGHVPAEVARLTPVGRVDSAQKLHLAIGLPLRNQAQLMDFINQLSDPASPNYRHYLTPAQFAERYGPTEKDYQAVIDFAKSHGLNVTTIYPNRLIVDVEGPVSVIEKAFNVKMLNYQHPSEARRFYAPDTEPSIDLQAPILGVSGLNNFSLPKPRYKSYSSSSKPAAISPISIGSSSNGSASPNIGTGPNTGYMGNDFRTAYAPGVTLTGAGQTVGLLQFDGYTTSDITYYEGKAGLPNVPITNVLLDSFNGIPTGNGGEVEVSLDIETAMSMAPGLSRIIVYEAGPSGNWHDILNRMTNDNQAKQLSCSWYIPGGTADSMADSIFIQMAAQGQSFFSASGDYDAFTGLIPFPGDTPYITEVGGTMLTTPSPGGAYGSEAAWNRNNGVGTGGGISTQYTIPSWQQGISMASNLGSTTMRNVPDVALTAEAVYVRADGVDQEVGGTSCAAPLWAGFTALVNQRSVSNSGTTVGFINPAVYAIGKGANYTSAFHDTTVGNNYWTSSPAKFPAVTGYDLCTGWGSPMGEGFIDALAGQATPIISTTSPLISGLAGTFYTQTLVARGGSPSYTFTLSSGSLPPSFSLNSGGVISGATSSTGTFNFTVRVADSKSVSSLTSFSLTIYPAGTPIITTSSLLPLAMPMVAYSQTLSATGGALPLTWTLASGSLPNGLTLSPTGTISGVPTTAGISTFTVQVAGNDGLIATVPFSLTVATPPTFTTGSPLSSGIVNAPYSQWLSATGGKTPYTFTLASGSLPAGLSLNYLGLISGTPTYVGTSNFSLTVTGNDGAFSAASFSITIAPSGPLDHFSWATISSPQTVNSPFAATITALDSVNNIVTTFGGTVALSAGAAQTILNSPTPTNNYNSATWTIGYSFTPSSNLQVTAVRSYSGTKVSIWSTTGTLLGSAAVTAPYGSWTETSLQTPITLQAGTTYVVGFLTGGQPYYDRTGLPSTFANGTINQTYYILGDGFPTNTDATHWWFVDLKYTVGTVVPITPTISGSFSSGNWTGNITVTQPGTGVVLNANDGSGHGGFSTAFNVTTAANLTVTPSTGLTSSGPAAGPFSPVSASYTVTNTGTGSMTWSAAGTAAWLTVSPSGGTLGPGANATVTASINSAANSLGVSNYTDTINFSNTTTSLGNTTRPVSLTVKLPAPVITSPSTAVARIGQSFNYQIAATNNPTSYNASGLPTGLNVSTSTGLISGTPTVAGVFNATISASNGNTGSAGLVITVQQPPAITNGPPPSAAYNAAYSFAYTSTGYPAPTFLVTTGSLPTGLTLSSAGVISGTPTVPGLFTGTVTASNGASPVATQNFSIAVQQPPLITNGPPPATVVVNSAYNFTYTASGYPAPTFTVTTGALPTGLTLSSAGVISGTATVVGNFTSTVTASNGVGTAATQAFSITILVAPPVAPVITPEPPFIAGTTNTVSWNAVNGATQYEVQASADGLFDDAIDSGWIASTNYTFTGLTVTATYSYRVRARNSSAPDGNWSQTSQSDFSSDTLKNAANAGAGITLTQASSTPVSGVITNTSFEQSSAAPTGWTTSSQGGQFGEIQASSWPPMPTAGANFFLMYSSYFTAVSAGDSYTLSQVVNLTGVSSIQFDAALGLSNSWNNEIKLDFQVDGVSYWTQSTQGNFSNQTIPLNGLSGSHTIAFRSTALASFSQTYTYLGIDNLRTNAVTYNSAGSIVSTSITPSPLQLWGTLSFNKDVSGNGTALTVDVLNSEGALLAANVTSGTNLSSLPAVATASSITLRANLSTSNAANTPRLNSWAVSYYSNSISPWSALVTSTQGLAPSFGAPPPSPLFLGTPYSYTYVPAGFPLPTFSVTTGALPPGLSLSSAGEISGTPTATGTFTGTVTATNEVSPDATQDFTLTVITSFSAWASQEGLTGNNSLQTAIISPDGLTNLYKYALGLDPFTTYSPGSGSLPSLSVQNIAGANYLTLTFNGVATDVTYTVQASSSLSGGWTTIRSFPSGGAAPGPQTVQDTQTVGSSPQREMRLLMTIP